MDRHDKKIHNVNRKRATMGKIARLKHQVVSGLVVPHFGQRTLRRMMRHWMRKK